MKTAKERRNENALNTSTPYTMKEDDSEGLLPLSARRCEMSGATCSRRGSDENVDNEMASPTEEGLVSCAFDDDVGGMKDAVTIVGRASNARASCTSALSLSSVSANMF